MVAKWLKITGCHDDQINFFGWPKLLVKNILETGANVHFVQTGLILSTNGYKVVDVAPAQ